MRASPALLVALALALALGLAGCGIPPEEEATLAQSRDVPFDLLEAAPGTTTPPTTPPASVTGTALATIFLVQGERLASVERVLPSPLSSGSVLEALVAGPTDTEVALGLRTALLAEGGPVPVAVAGGIATVDLGPSFTEIAGRDQILALAQIVSTLTGLPGIGRVSFTLGGVPVGVPRGDGAVTAESVSRDDYAPLAPVPAG